MAGINSLSHGCLSVNASTINAYHLAFLLFHEHPIIARLILAYSLKLSTNYVTLVVAANDPDCDEASNMPSFPQARKPQP